MQKMFSGKFIILALAAAVSAHNFGNSNQYDHQGNNGLRSPSFLTSQRFGNTNFGVRSGLSTNSRNFNQNSQFGLNGFGTNNFARTNHFGSAQNNFGNTNSGRSSQFNRQSSLARNQQFGGTAEAGAQVLSERSENDGFGQYSYSFETDNGIRKEESAVPTGFGTSAVSGSYSYISPEGVDVVVHYTADENGFQVDSPNVPPVPLHAQQQIEDAREARARGLIDENGNPTSAGGFQSSNFNSQRSSNLFNQNSRFRTNNNFNQFGSQSGFGNSQRTAVFRRPFNNNQASVNSFGSQTFGRNFNNGVSRFGPRQQNQQFRSSFRQNNQRLGNSFGQQNGRFDQFGQGNQHFGTSFNQRNRGFSQFRQDNQKYGTPSLK